MSDLIRASMVLPGDIMFKGTRVSVIKKITYENTVDLELSNGRIMNLHIDQKVPIFNYD